MSSLTHRYIPRTNQREENYFLEEYYSSTDTKIYIDDEEQTEIGYINYSLQEQLKPVYGYASRTFDDVAIGNRIVTGMIKIPIKNIAKQSTYEEVVEVSKGNTIDEYNKGEEDIKDTIDWITGQGESPDISFSDTGIDQTQEDYEYSTKLRQIGYNTQWNDGDLKSLIKFFQKENELDETGEFNTETKNKIDELLMLENLETIIIPVGTKIYTLPSVDADGIPVSEETEVYVLDRGYEGGWIYVTTKNGMEGYINIYEFEEVT